MDRHQITRRTLLAMGAAAVADSRSSDAHAISPERLEVLKRVPTLPTRERWTSSRQYFLSPTGSDSNNGRSHLSPWATPAFAHEYLQRNHDINGFNAIIRFAPGTYTGVRGQLTAHGPLIGQQDEGNYNWRGVSGDPGAVKLMGAGFHAYKFAQFNLIDVEISTNQMACISSQSCALIEIYRVRFPNVGNRYHMWSRGQGYILAMDKYQITGSAARHANTTNDGYIGLQQQITISPGVRMSGAFAFTQSGTIELSGATLIGSFTGQRFRCLDGGSVRTSSGDPLFIPGTIDGVTSVNGVITGFYS